MTTTTTTTGWDSEGYWHVVIGLDAPKSVIKLWGLNRATLADWIAAAEKEALRAAGLGETPEEWGMLRADAIEVLRSAMMDDGDLDVATGVK